MEFVGPSWLIWLWIRQETIAISFVLWEDLVVFKLKDKTLIGGDCLFRSLMVTSTSIGFDTTISCLHQVLLKFAWFYTFDGFLIVSQHGPLIFLLRINSSSILWLAPNRHSKVFPVRFTGSGGYVDGYLIFKNLCSPWEIGISKQYFLETNLHLKPDILLNLLYLSWLNSSIMLYNWFFSSSSLKEPLALLFFIFGKAKIVLSIPWIFNEQDTNSFNSGCQTLPNKYISAP